MHEKAAIAAAAFRAQRTVQTSHSRCALMSSSPPCFSRCAFSRRGSLVRPTGNCTPSRTRCPRPMAAHLPPTRSAPVLKGIGIGNGLVSPRALIDTFVEFAATNAYGRDLLGSSEEALRDTAAQFAVATRLCEAASSSRVPTRRVSLRGNAGKEDCDAAVDLYQSFNAIADSEVVSSGRNVYDIRRECHRDDRIGLCYRFSRLEAFVNQAPVLAYFGASARTWELCSGSTMHTLRRVDFVEESESRVADLLEQGVRVLVYGGDADAVVNWKCQDVWTRRLGWSGQRAFNAAPVEGFDVSGRRAGLVRSAGGLSFLRVFEAGHVRWQLLLAAALSRAIHSSTTGVCGDGSSRPTASGVRNGAALPPPRVGGHQQQLLVDAPERRRRPLNKTRNHLSYPATLSSPSSLPPAYALACSLQDQQSTRSNCASQLRKRARASDKAESARPLLAHPIAGQHARPHDVLERGAERAEGAEAALAVAPAARPHELLAI
ncbi:hypothetical protein PybrP1_008036 [[Pythium] brassicae (nom. inval.)]|nr:hypothetical protein PybrP1_008036 [[Pythium] brassicae (nom. inval.)]